jgi:FAD/FMN-containing dehydrogenase
MIWSSKNCPRKSCSPSASNKRASCCATPASVGNFCCIKIDQPLGALRGEFARVGLAQMQSVADERLALEPQAQLFHLLQDRSIRVSWKVEVKAAIERIFQGQAFKPILEACEKMHKRVLRGRVFVALHMHAGDGNVHTNIPVNSDDYDMLKSAEAAVARIMALARSLDGVISGEHGIGITKLEYLLDEETREFRDYKQRIDPEGRLTRASFCQVAICAMPTPQALA